MTTGSPRRVRLTRSHPPAELSAPAQTWPDPQHDRSTLWTAAEHAAAAAFRLARMGSSSSPRAEPGGAHEPRRTVC